MPSTESTARLIVQCAGAGGGSAGGDAAQPTSAAQVTSAANGGSGDAVRSCMSGPRGDVGNARHRCELRATSTRIGTLVDNLS